LNSYNRQIIETGGRRGRVAVGFTTAYAISAYHH